MSSSNATSVEEYLDTLPDERRETISTVRDVIIGSLPGGYRESMNWGMICYEIPLERYPDTYNGQPLCYIGLASQKNYCSLYLTNVYQSQELTDRMREAFREAGKKLDMGKSCVRFRRADDLPLEVIAEVVSATSPEEYIATYEEGRSEQN
jgi:hypothetical protein